MTRFNLSKEEIQKTVVSSLGGLVACYLFYTLVMVPMDKDRVHMLGAIAELETRITDSARTIRETAELETPGKVAEAQSAELDAQTPPGPPIAWLPPKLRQFFTADGVPPNLARLVGSAPMKQPELAVFQNFDCSVIFERADFRGVMEMLSRMENEEPTMSVTSLKVSAVTDDPEFQKVILGISALLKP